MTLNLLPDDEMNFSVEPDHSGCLILTAECHKDDSGRKISFSIRLDQIPRTCSTRRELVNFIDDYARGRKVNGLLVPRDEYKFHIGFAPETEQILLFPEMMIRDGYVQPDRIPLSDLPEDARTVNGLEKLSPANAKDKNNMAHIEWKITEQESQQEMVSADGRWHVTKNQKGNQEPSFYLSNYDLLLSPHGSGTDYKECFETFIADCDTFIEKIKTIRDQARMHMDEMLAAAKELESHEN